MTRKVYHRTDDRWRGKPRDAGGHFLSSERRARVRLIIVVLTVGLLILLVTAVLSRQPDVDPNRIEYIDVDSESAPADEVVRIPFAFAVVTKSTLLQNRGPIPPINTTQVEPETGAGPVGAARGVDGHGVSSGAAETQDIRVPLSAVSVPEPIAPEPAIDPADPVAIAQAIAALPQPKGPIVRDASPDDPLRVYVGGDSLSDAPRWGLVNSDTNIVVTGDTHVSTGVVAEWYFDWVGQVEQVVAPAGYDVVVLTMGANDAQRFQFGFEIGSAEWNAEYELRVETMFTSLEGGPLVVWVGMPPVAPVNIGPAVEAANAITSATTERFDHVEYVDAFTLFSGPDGGFAERMAGPDGVLKLVRAGDGVHYSSTAGDWLADAILDKISSRMAAGDTLG